MLDLFCGRWGWSRAFHDRGWECIGIDLLHSPECQPERSAFVQDDVMNITAQWIKNCGFDFICASPPCEQFSVHGMKHFHPNPPFPTLGVKLFQRAQDICEDSEVPFVIENVRAAQEFVGQAVHHCGPFYLWGTGVPAVIPRGIRKGISQAVPNLKNKTRAEITAWRREHDPMWNASHSKARKEITAKAATIPPELANCVADYACNLLSSSSSRDLGRDPVVTSSGDGS